MKKVLIFREIELSSPKLKEFLISQEEIPKPKNQNLLYFSKKKKKNVMNKYGSFLFSYHEIHGCGLIRISFAYTHFWEEYA